MKRREVDALCECPLDLAVAHNRPCYQLWKQRHIRCIGDKIFLPCYPAAVHVHTVADNLKRIERNTDWQRDRLCLDTKHHIHKKLKIFEVK